MKLDSAERKGRRSTERHEPDLQPGNTPSLSESQPSPEPRVQSNAGSVENPRIGQADAAQKLDLVYSNAITLRTGPLGQPLGQQEMAAPRVEGERHEQPDAGGVGMTVPVLRKSVALSWAEAGASRTLEPPPMHYEPHFQRDIPEGRKRQPGG